ncbi:hypothetical protein Plec18167_009715 [Paecilomyces lecythidis]|uniref:Cytochrome P450 n=1 Tax=Paecilomyces lecythidis TaxID=3004212 RepID=A0ABR3WLM9_9EURO
MHKKYGDFVRTGTKKKCPKNFNALTIIRGPAGLTIFHPETLATIYDNYPFNKPAWYDNLRPYTGLNTHRSKYVHKHRRRVWDHAFTASALRSYQEVLKSKSNALDELVMKRAGHPIIINDFFYWASWDMMGQLGFSKTFGMLQGQKWHYAIQMLRKGLTFVGPYTSVPWLVRIAFDLRILPSVRNFIQMEDWCARQMDERIEISGHLIAWSVERNRLQKDLPTLYGDSIAIIVAGSDTVAHTLIYAFYHLARDSSQLRKLREEQADTDLQDFRQLQCLPHLNGIINEVLRLYPPVPTGGFRETPSEGAEIGGRWIPGKTLICAPRWTIGRRKETLLICDR